MADQYIHLVGAEEVNRAGINIMHAAESMQSSVAHFEALVDRLVAAMESHASRVEAAMGGGHHD